MTLNDKKCLLKIVDYTIKTHRADQSFQPKSFDYFLDYLFDPLIALKPFV